MLLIFLVSIVPQVLSRQSLNNHDMNVNMPQVVPKQWVDPHDMNINAREYVQKSFSLEDEDLPHGKEECNVNVGENNSLIYLKRVINLLLYSANMDKSEVEHSGRLYFTISDEDLIYLKGFSSMRTVNMDDLRKIDTILSNGLKRSYLHEVSDIFLSAQEKVFQLISSQNCLPLLGLSLFMYIAYSLFKRNFSTWYVVRYFILMVILVDFLQRYQQLYQEAEEHNMNLKYSLKCDTTKMSWGEYFKFLTSNEDCEKKVVSVLEVGLNQVRSVIIIPLAAAGTGMGQFGSELWKNLPWPWNILIFPIMLIFCAILTAIIMTTVNNTPFKFNLMHLFHLEFGEKQPSTITGKTLEKLLDAVNHRPLLQDVPSATKKTPPKNTNKPIKCKKQNKNKLDEKKAGEVQNDDKKSEIIENVPNEGNSD